MWLSGFWVLICVCMMQREVLGLEEGWDSLVSVIWRSSSQDFNMKNMANQLPSASLGLLRVVAVSIRVYTTYNSKRMM